MSRRTAVPLLRSWRRVDPDTEVVGIDEGQFFDNDLVTVANELASRGVRVIIAGLDQDYTGKPWEPMPQLLAIAEYITKTHAICMKCGQPANYSQRTFDRRNAWRSARLTSTKPLPDVLRPHADAPTVHI
jgi:thymidine kinase